MMTEEEFFEYVRYIAAYDGDEVISIEYNEGSTSYFGVYNPDYTNLASSYTLYEMDAFGDVGCNSIGTHEEWRTYGWPDGSNQAYHEYVEARKK